jgi:hypothetical protein
MSCYHPKVRRARLLVIATKAADAVFCERGALSETTLSLRQLRDYIDRLVGCCERAEKLSRSAGWPTGVTQ